MPEDPADEDDLLALLVPDDVPGRHRTPFSTAAAPAGVATAAAEPLADPPAPVRPALPPGARADGAPVVVGRRFHPVPGVPLVGPDGVLVASGGTTVHAVEAGRVEFVPDGLRLRTARGLELDYEGLTATRALDDGSRVPAGAVLGVLAGPAGRPATLRLRVRGATGTELDPAELLLGLADPDELGFASGGTGVGVDPDEMDRALAAEVEL